MTNSTFQNFISELKQLVSMPEIAEALGLAVVYSNKETPVTLCPFHDDTTPSLHLYKDHYHCFVCASHGDIFSLVKEQKGYDFKEALQWIAGYKNLSIPSAKRNDIHKRERSIKDGYQFAYEIFSAESEYEKKLRNTFENKRGFSENFLQSVDAFGVKGNKILATNYGRVELDLLIEKNLIFYQKDDLNLESYINFFYQNRIIFTLKNPQGDIVGFAGRATEKEVKPKYKFRANALKFLI